MGKTGPSKLLIAGGRKTEKDRLKTFQVYRDVLIDINETALIETEKSAERDHVTNMRKEALGSNLIYCPPCSSSESS